MDYEKKLYWVSLRHCCVFEVSEGRRLSTGVEVGYLALLTQVRQSPLREDRQMLGA